MEDGELFTATSPATGDAVKVWAPLDETGEAIRPLYSINGGPPCPVDREFLGVALKSMTFSLLLRHIRECEVSDAEELTLP